MIKNISKIFFTNVVGKLLGFIKIAALIKLFGTNSVTDALIVALSIYWFFSGIIVSSLFSISLVPQLALVKSQKWQVFKSLRLLFSVNLVGLIVFCLILFFTKEIVYIFAPINDALFVETATRLMLILLPLLLLIPATEIFTIQNQFNNRMILGSFNKIVWNILQIAAIYVCFYYFEGSSQLLVLLFGVFTCFGYLITSALQLVGCGYFNYFKFNQLFRLSLKSSITVIKKHYMYFFAVMLSQLNLYIDNYFISSLTAGSISRYNILIKVPEVVQSILNSSLTVVFFNQISLNKNAIGRTLKQFYKFLFPLFIVGLISVKLLGVDVLSLVYGADALSMYAPSYIRKILYVITANVFFMISISLMVKVFVTTNRPRLLLLSSGVNVIVNIVANYLLIGPFGIYGIALSTLASSYILHGIFLSTVFKFGYLKKLALVALFIFLTYALFLYL